MTLHMDARWKIGILGPWLAEDRLNWQGARALGCFVQHRQWGRGRPWLRPWMTRSWKVRRSRSPSKWLFTVVLPSVYLIIIWKD